MGKKGEEKVHVCNSEQCCKGPPLSEGDIVQTCEGVEEESYVIFWGKVMLSSRKSKHRSPEGKSGLWWLTIIEEAEEAEWGTCRSFYGHVLLFWLRQEAG